MNWRTRMVGIIWLALLPMLSSAAGAFDVRGVSLAHLHRPGFGYGSEECRKQLQAIAATGATWVAINDFANMRSVDDPVVRFGDDPTLREADLVKTIEDAHALGLKVLVKPHIWCNEFWNAVKWHGDIRMHSEADWDQWFAEYTEYVLHHARIAQKTGAAALCIGVEYEGTADQEQRWRSLIARVREVYDGKLTYAAAFMEFPKIQWWDALDCIGIDAYFPLTDQPAATLADLRSGWARVYDQLEPFARRWNMPVCFTEIGYTDSIWAGKEPWSYSRVDPDPAYQARLYQAALEEARGRPYLVGLFVWKWFTADVSTRRRRDPYTMQDRPLVLEVLKSQWFPIANNPARSSPVSSEQAE